MDIKIIKSELRKRHINYDKLAEMTGISKSAIAKIMCGYAKNPRHETMTAIEDALNMAETTPLVARYLSEDEEELIGAYKNLSPKNKSLVKELAKALE